MQQCCSNYQSFLFWELFCKYSLAPIYVLLKETIPWHKLSTQFSLITQHEYWVADFRGLRIKTCFLFRFWSAPAGIYLLKVNTRNTRIRYEICSELIIKTMASFWCLYCKLWTYFTPCSSVSIAKFEQVIVGWYYSFNKMM